MSAETCYTPRIMHKSKRPEGLQYGLDVVWQMLFWGVVCGIILVVLIILSGCAAKRPIRPIHGQAVAHYDLSKCKPFRDVPGALVCDGVVFMPLTLDSKQLSK